MPEPCLCRDYSCSGSRDFAIMRISGHHPMCPKRSVKPIDDVTIIGHLLMMLDKERGDSAKREAFLEARCNRMCSSAAIEDVTWRPKT